MNAEEKPKRTPKKSTAQKNEASPEKKEAAEIKKSVAEIKKSAAEIKKSAAEIKKSAAESKKSAAESKKSAAEGKKSAAESKKSAAEGKKPAAKAKKTQPQKDVYAIIRSGGKQYCVREDDFIDVELLKQDPGSKVEFREVLFVNDGTPRVGEPNVSGSMVTGEVVDEASGPKVVSLKYKPRQHSIRKFGHRQHYTRVKITEIAVG